MLIITLFFIITYIIICLFLFFVFNESLYVILNIIKLRCTVRLRNIKILNINYTILRYFKITTQFYVMNVIKGYEELH
jgi:hypothetical protein